MKNSERDRFQTFLSILFLTLILFSILFSSAETEHKLHCNEDNCPVCLVLAAVKSNLEILIFVFAVFKISHNFVKSEKIKGFHSNKTYISDILFSLKTRLND